MVTVRAQCTKDKPLWALIWEARGFIIIGITARIESRIEIIELKDIMQELQSRVRKPRSLPQMPLETHDTWDWMLKGDIWLPVLCLDSHVQDFPCQVHNHGKMDTAFSITAAYLEMNQFDSLINKWGRVMCNWK